MHAQNRTSSTIIPRTKPQDAQACYDRFAIHLEALQTWKNQHNSKSGSSPRVIWQTLFPSNHPPTITHAMIDWDYACQTYLAVQEGIELSDLYRPIQKVGSKHLITDMHFARPSDYRKYLVQPYVETCCVITFENNRSNKCACLTLLSLYLEQDAWVMES